MCDLNIIIDNPHKLIFKHYEKRTSSKVPNTWKEVKLDDRLVMSRKKDKETSIPYTEVYVENRQPDRIGVMINTDVDKKKKVVSYIYEIQINGEPIEKAYEKWLKSKEKPKKTKNKNKSNNKGSQKKKGSKKKTASKKKK